jgi:DNA polymerase elongation subunit (family B)
MSARRDNAEFAVDLYVKVLYETMLKQNLYTVLKYAYDGSVNLLKGNVDIEQLVVVKKLGAVYKNDTYSMKRFADRMKKIGKPMEPGDRVGYLVVKNKNSKYLGDRMITVDMYNDNKSGQLAIGYDGNYEIDYAYYLERTLGSHLDQILKAAYGEELLKTGIEYRASNRCKVIYFNKPIAFMCKMLKYDLDIEMIGPLIEELKPKERKEKRRRRAITLVDEI